MRKASRMGSVQPACNLPGNKLDARRIDPSADHSGRILLVFDDVTKAVADDRHKDLLAAELAHRIALFRARGEIAPYEEESFAPDSWRAFFVGHGSIPDSYLPGIDRTAPEVVKAQFRHMLGFVKAQVLRQPTHDSYLQAIGRGDG